MKILNPSFFNAVSRSQSRPPFFSSFPLPRRLRAGMGTSPYRIFKQINQLAVCAEFSLSVAAGGSGLNLRKRGVGRCAASVLLASTYSCTQWGQHVTPSSTQSIPSATLRGWTHSTIWVCCTPFSIPTHWAATEDKAQPRRLNIHHVQSYSRDLNWNKPRQGKPDRLQSQRARSFEIFERGYVNLFEFSPLGRRMPSAMIRA